MKTTTVKLSELTPDPKNTRTHDERNIQTIMDSLKRFGQYRPFVVQKKGMIIRVGNGMYEAMKRLGWQEANATIKDLSDEEATTLSILDNRSSELAEWDDELLAEILQGLPDDLSELTGFSEKELFEIADRGLNPSGEEKELPEIPKSPKTEPGRIYQLGKHRLMCGDSACKADVEKLMDGEKADMVFTDPPFDLEDHKWFNFYDENILKIIFHSDKNISMLAASHPEQFSYFLVNYYSFGFALSGNHPQMAHNIIGVFNSRFKIMHDGFKTVICEQMERNRLMPHAKNIKLINKILVHYEGDVIIDPFGGSGSTLIACEQINRQCRMMEIDPHYCDVIIERYCNFTGADKKQAFKTSTTNKEENECNL